MKLSLVSSILLLSVFILSCNKKKKEVDVPAKVKASLIENFPDATEITWDKETETEWEADFKMYENKYSANFDPEGKMLVMEYDMNIKDLPVKIKLELDSLFTGYTIKKAEHGEKENWEFFEIELANNTNTLEVVYDHHGNMIENDEMNNEKGESESD